VINFFNQTFKEVYTMQEDIAIDESLMNFKGRLSYKQFNPSKRTRFGIKQIISKSRTVIVNEQDRETKPIRSKPGSWLAK